MGETQQKKFLSDQSLKVFVLRAGLGSHLIFLPVPAPATDFFSSDSGSMKPKTPGAYRLRLPSPGQETT